MSSSPLPVAPLAEAAAPAEAPSPPPATAAVAPCPISADFLPPNMRKYVDPQGPVPLRMMAAKALVPLSPSDMVAVLFMLSFDLAETVRQAAAGTLFALPDRILSPSLRDEALKPPVLGHCLQVFAGNEEYVQTLTLNGSTPDEAVAVVAGTCSAKIAEIICQNQLRILRNDNILRKLCRNPNALVSVIDGVCDFAVRSGMLLQDVPQMQQARVRVFGPRALLKPPQLGPTAEEVVNEYRELRDDNAPPVEAGKRLTVSQRVTKMSISEKIKLATLGNREARGLLMRDNNKLVAVAVIRSPRITDGEVLAMANNRAIIDEVLRIIYSNREWIKNYSVKLALAKNPKTPLAISMRFLSTLQESDVRALARNKNVQAGIQLMAKKMLEKKNALPKS